MDDTTSREQVIATIDSFNVFESRYDQIKLELMIRELPSAQPEIIRCKDCKYWKRSSCCEGYCGEIDMEGFDEDHYCGFAERREVTE
jgi:hypothetical protein